MFACKQLNCTYSPSERLAHILCSDTGLFQNSDGCTGKQERGNFLVDVGARCPVRLKWAQWFGLISSPKSEQAKKKTDGPTPGSHSKPCGSCTVRTGILHPFSLGIFSGRELVFRLRGRAVKIFKCLERHPLLQGLRSWGEPILITSL